MKFLRKHWYDLGGLFSILVLGYILINYQSLSNYQLILWASLVSLFFHQLEEYRIVGTFPGMINSAVFKSTAPDRYPLNTNTALLINVCVGWIFYLLAALFAEKAIWLGIATIMISVGNIIAHTFLFNIKGKTFYNAGMLTCWMFFLPLSFFFFMIIHGENLATSTDYYVGITLGILLNIFGVLKPIEWLANKDTPYIFEDRNLLPKNRKEGSN